MRPRAMGVNIGDASARRLRYVRSMASAAPKPPHQGETLVEREARLERMRAFLNEGLADIAAGRFIEGDEADRWLEGEIAEAEDAAR